MSIRVSLSYAEAEALLGEPVAAKTRLRARGKLTSALLAKRDYTPPKLRRSNEPRYDAPPDA